ncbi:VIT1/CCC1 transporter family protein [Holosporaceae bacterium 'Namur']|nr:VIT1/CCC1 transporter family protein [Holosporaceae bacterium 'Namur']
MLQSNSEFHQEHHAKSSVYLQDFVLGMADGLTVPFALVAGLSGAVDCSNIIVIAGISEIAAGTIAMGMGGYLAAKTQREHYETELARETKEIEEVPEIEAMEVEAILEDFGITEAESKKLIVDSLRKDPKKWRDFMMRFELNLEKLDKNREVVSPFIIGSAYAIGGFVPLSPYIFTSNIEKALSISIIATTIALLGFGAFKGACTGVSVLKSALHTCFIGGIAAAAAYSIAKLVA